MFEKEKKEKKNDKKQGRRDRHENMTCMSNRWSQSRKKIIYESQVVTQSFHKTILVDILGPVKTWLRPQMRYSEWDYVRNLYVHKQAAPLIRISAATLFSTLVPILGFGYYGKSMVHGKYEKKPVHYAGHEYELNNKFGEEWWYLSGTGVNEDLQGANALQLAHIFKKKIRLFYNPTSGVLFDFVKSMSGLITYKSTAPKRLALALLMRYNDNRDSKTVLIGHSYGSIVIVNAVKYLIKKGYIDCLRNIEIYTFGCPCIEISSTIDPVTFHRVPFYEHYVHIGDFVARVGAYRLLNGHHWVVGKVFTADKQGHLLGEHYLPSFVHGEFQWEGGDHHSRLMSYLPQDISREQLLLDLSLPAPSSPLPFEITGLPSELIDPTAATTTTTTTTITTICSTPIMPSTTDISTTAGVAAV